MWLEIKILLNSQFQSIDQYKIKEHIVILGILNGFLLISLIFSCILHFLSKEEMGSACFSWCKSKISWCSKHSGEKTSLNQPSDQNTYDLIASPAKESRCKCKNRCKAENSGDKQCRLKSAIFYHLFSDLPFLSFHIFHYSNLI